jgi:hypothetical protein
VMRCRSVEAESHPHPHSYRVVSATSDSSRVAAEDFGGADGRILFVIRQCRVCESEVCKGEACCSEPQMEVCGMHVLSSSQYLGNGT